MKVVRAAHFAGCQCIDRRAKFASGRSSSQSRAWDPIAQAAWKYNESNHIFLTYDDERSVTAKVKYVKDKGLNGIFFWELRLDRPKNGLADIIYSEMQK